MKKKCIFLGFCNMDDLFKRVLTDLKVELTEEFDRNFERKAFFTKRWKDRKLDGRGSLLLTTGKLRRSIRAKVDKESVTWSSSEPYAAIHNYGGRITVTAKMKRFFWAKFYELSGRIRYRKDGKPSKSSQKYSRQAEFYRNLALMKIGSKIEIPQRQFLGDSPEVRKCVKTVCKEQLNAVVKDMVNQTKRKVK